MNVTTASAPEEDAPAPAGPVAEKRSPADKTEKFADFLSLAKDRVIGRRVVFGKSIPRSGHHYLVRLMLAYYGEELRYCRYGFNKNDDCCHRLPCSRRFNGKNVVFFQKSHDFQLDDDKRLFGKYLIQIRSLMPSILSHFDLALKEYSVENSKEFFGKFCTSKTNHFIGFHRRWVANGPRSRLVVEYKSLADRPAETLANVVRFIGKGRPSDARIAAALSKANAGAPPAARDPRTHRYFDEALFTGLEKRVLEACGPQAMQFLFIKP